MATAHASRIPVVGQAVLGFLLPWILALVAIPLEMFLESGRHVLSSVVAWLLRVAGWTVRLVGHVFDLVLGVLPGLIDIYVAVPLRIEAMIRGRRGELPQAAPAPSGRAA